MSKDDDRVKEEFTSEAEELLDALSNDLGEFETQGKNGTTPPCKRTW